jgi:hypothetical protein
LSSHDGRTRKGEEKGKVAIVVLGLEVTVVVDGVDASRHRRAGGRSLSIVVVGGVDVGRRKLSLSPTLPMEFRCNEVKVNTQKLSSGISSCENLKSR